MFPSYTSTLSNNLLEDKSFNYSDLLVHTILEMNTVNPEKIAFWILAFLKIDSEWHSC